MSSLHENQIDFAITALREVVRSDGELHLTPEATVQLFKWLNSIKALVVQQDILIQAVRNRTNRTSDE